MSRTISAAVCVAILVVTPGLVLGQTSKPTDLGNMTIEDLLGVEVISGASKFLQDIREAPASISVITAEDIHRYGHRTLADILRSVRGLYTTYDRNYMYLGTRGFSRPGDYNTRVLLLVDGHRLNDGTYDMAPVGTDFPIDVSLIERVEVIRGPASSLYGSNAFFGVINVVTRSGGAYRGVRVEADRGSLDTSRVAASYGRAFADGRELLIGGSTYGSSGQKALFYPEFAAETTGGTARDLDDDDAKTLFGSMSWGSFSLRGSVAERRKRVPTGSYATTFGDQRAATTDRRAYLDLGFDGSIGRGWSAVARAAVDYYGYQGAYPYDYGDPGIVVYHDGSDTFAASGELTARRRLGRSHLFTAGLEVRRQVRNHQWAYDINGPQLDVRRPSTALGVYAQDEVRLRPWLLANAGVRFDKLAGYGYHATPRAALVALPRERTSIKLLYGRAFRAPNAYELYYYDAARESDLRIDPERMESTELVWEETLSRHVRATVSAFRYDVDGIIEQQATGGDDDLSFANVNGMRGTGIEAELESRFANGLAARLSHTVARVRDTATDGLVSNSPTHMSKAAVQLPAGLFTIAIEAVYVGERHTLAGERLGGFLLPNVAITTPPGRRMGFSFGVYNAVDRRYADPGAAEHIQQAIGQDGRTVLARVRVGF